MKYTTSIEIEKPLAEVVALFDSEENLKEWQPELIKYEHLSGTPGKEGAKARLLYQMGRRKVEMTETIIQNNLPVAFNVTYEAKGVWNEVKTSFEELGNNSTRWITTNEFRFGSFFMKIMCWLMPGAFKKQSLKYMENFKRFAESK